MGRALATVLTLGLLSRFVFAVVLFTFLLLFVSPTINDFVHRWLYDMEWVTIEEFQERSPASATVIEDATEKYRYDQPKLGLIADRNPTAVILLRLAAVRCPPKRC
jgi:hypothetical protein